MNLRRAAAIILLLSLPALTPPAGATPQQSSEASPAPDERTAQPAVPDRPPASVPRATEPIVVDGVLDDAAWADALRLELPYEVWPADSTAAAVRTVALLAYDEGHVYIGFEAHDPQPHVIRARLSDRDTAFQDDFVGVVLDTFNDGRRAYEFFVNAMGVQMDLVVDDVSGNEDSSWDAIWESAGRLTEDGYHVEIAIPYTSLRFQRAAGGQTWGLDLIRIYPRDQRYLLASNPRNRDISCYLCQVGKVVGFDGATPGRNLEITPTLTAIRTDSAPTTGASIDRGDPDYEAGVTAKWGITPNMVLSGTLNPDFSQVEADVAQLDVNEQFALFFPEKRPFFLEGSDFFDTPIRIVHTRTVADPSWGMKVTGKEGAHALGAFAAEDDRTNLVFPGSQRSLATSLEVESVAGVARYRRDIGNSSAIGGLVTVRDGEGYSSGVAGADALIRFAESDSIRAQALVSRTTYPDEVAADFGQPGGDFGDTAFALNYNHSTRDWSWWGRYRDIGEDFRADLGFVPQVDIRQPVVGTEYRWWGDENNWWTRWAVGGDWDQTGERDGDLIERET